MNAQIKKAKYFRKLHESFFLLPNAWNGGSAKVFAKSGYKAIGTTSAGIAYSLGFSDGEIIQFSDVLRVTKEILKVTDLPLTVDLERGYGASINEIIDNIKKVILLGAVGINIEDGLPNSKAVDEIEYFSELISRISELRKQMKIPFVINARTDIFLLNTDSNEIMLESCINRAKILKESGADCIFIPGALDKATIIKLRENIELPINLFLHPKFNDIEELEKIGINRLSSGSAFVRTVYNNLIDFSFEFQNGENNNLLDHKFHYNEANNYFKD